VEHEKRRNAKKPKKRNLKRKILAKIRNVKKLKEKGKKIRRKELEKERTEKTNYSIYPITLHSGSTQEGVWFFYGVGRERSLGISCWLACFLLLAMVVIKL
jgi:hypothetical protein